MQAQMGNMQRENGLHSTSNHFLFAKRLHDNEEHKPA